MTRRDLSLWIKRKGSDQLNEPTMPSQADKAAVFRELHARPTAFIIPNPWDVGSARILEHLGFEALATTSVGYAYSIARRDHKVTRDEMIAHAAEMCSATSVPVSADLENGFGDDVDTVAETIRMAADAGLAGCSIEDSTNRTSDPIYQFEHAVDRIRAAVAAARPLSFPFTLTDAPKTTCTAGRISARRSRDSKRIRTPAPTSYMLPGLRNRRHCHPREVSRSAGECARWNAGRALHAGGTLRGRRETSERGWGAVARGARGDDPRGARDARARSFTFVDEPITSREISEMLG